MKNKRKLTYSQWRKRVIRTAFIVGFIPSFIVSVLAGIEYETSLTWSAVGLFLVSGLSLMAGIQVAEDKDVYVKYLKDLEDES